MSLQAIAVACYYSAPLAWNSSAVDKLDELLTTRKGQPSNAIVNSDKKPPAKPGVQRITHRTPDRAA